MNIINKFKSMSTINFKFYLLPLFLKASTLMHELDEYKKETEKKMKKEENLSNDLEKENNIIKAKFNEQKKIVEKEKKAILQNLEKIKKSIEINQSKNDLKELKESNNLEELKIVNKNNVDLIDLENSIKIENFNKTTEFLIKQKKIMNEIRLIKFKRKIYYEDKNEDKIKEYNELIEKTKNQIEGVIKEKTQYIFSRKNEYEEEKNNFTKKIENAKEKINLEIQIKQFEFENFKLSKINEGLLDKKRKFDEFKNKCSAYNLCSEKLKNSEIDKMKNYYELLKNNLLYKEQLFQQQKQNINSFIKNLEISNMVDNDKIIKLLKNS